jgi:maltodextrin utilization protein YvdJ
MKKHFGVAVLTIVALAMAFTACAVKPQAAIDAAQAAVAAVVNAGADKYAPAEIKTIQDDLTAALDQVTNKKYKEAGEALVKIKADADALLAALPAKIEAAKTSALGLQTAVKAALTEVKTIFEKNKWKITRPNRTALDTEIKGLDGTLPEVQTAVDAQDWIGATAKATTIKDSAAAILEKIKKLLSK